MQRGIKLDGPTTVGKQPIAPGDSIPLLQWGAQPACRHGLGLVGMLGLQLPAHNLVARAPRAPLACIRAVLSAPAAVAFEHPQAALRHAGELGAPARHAMP